MYDIQDVDWSDGLTRNEYDTLVSKLSENIGEIAEQEGELQAYVDDFIANFELFGMGVYYEQAYLDILDYADAGPDSDIARSDTPESKEMQVKVKAGEVLTAVVQRRILDRQ